MKTKKLHPYYYKLRRIAKTADLIATMMLVRTDKEFAAKQKSLIDECETAMLCHYLANRFYKSNDLLK